MDDEAAARACRAGNEEAFRHFVDGYQTRALAHARLLTRNDADGADATQEAFVDAFRNLSAFDPARPFHAWFHVLAPLVHQLWPIGVAVLGWRAVQLFVDLPMPALHPIVPLVAAVAVAWRVGGDLLAIETLAIVLGMKALTRAPPPALEHVAVGRGWRSDSRRLTWCWSSR